MIYLDHNATTPVLPEVFEATRSNLPALWEGSNVGCRAMRDRLSKERRSWKMSRIRGKDTTPEMVVRSLLHRMGYRFRLHGKKLPGRPDIVLPKDKTVVFVDGCFWHRHRGFKNRTPPKQRGKWWLRKWKAAPHAIG